MWTRIGVLGVVLVAVALWWWGRSSERPRVDRARDGLEAAGEKREPARRSEPSPELEEKPQGHRLDEDIGEIEEEVDDGPPDPVGKGPCELFLLFVDETTGQPVATRVNLWRLDAPGNVDWTRGDQLQLAKTVGVAGRVFRNLPAGNYRISCDAQRGGEDPPAFGVSGERTRQEFAIPIAREFTIRLRVVDETGRSTTTGEMMHVTSGESHSDRPPAWVRSRRPTGPFGLVNETIGFDQIDVPRTDVDGDTFLLGTMRQNTKVARLDRCYVLEWKNGTNVAVRVDGTLKGDRTYLGVTVPVERVREWIRVPGGRLSPKIQAECEAIVLTPKTPADVWRRLPITVTVRAKGYKPLAFHYRIDGPNRVHVLVSD